jgi:plastocyanin
LKTEPRVTIRTLARVRTRACAGSEDLCECTADEDCAGKDTDLCDAVGLVCDVENSKCVDSAIDAVVCDAAEVSTCEEVACEPSTGECVVAQKAEYASCDDGDDCTGCAPGVEECDNAHDYCNANGVCQAGSGTPCSCTDDIDCAPLDDGDYCNGGFICFFAACEEVAVLDPGCTEQQAPVCHTLSCTPETGGCDAFPVAEGTPCDPTPGVGPEYSCVAARECTAEQACEIVEYKEDGTECGWSGETCQAGECTAPVVLTLCEQFCETAAANCTDDSAITWTADCATDCAGWPEGEDGDTGANTTHCRLYHAGAAADDAALHCPHASPDGGGVCVDPDPCDGVVCADGETCEAGVCTAPVVATLCEQYCEATAANCTEDSAITWTADCATDCAGWPEGEDGDTAANTTHCRLYHAGVAADDAALHCPHASPDGGGVCVDADPCDGVVCDTPPAAGCDGNSAMTYGAGGTCAAGVCEYTESSTDCGDDVCNAGVCEPASPAFQCDAAYAGCTEEDFNANDMTAMVGSIDVEIVALAPYSPKCLRVAVGQTVNIEASGGHPFEKVCAEDAVMDAQDGNTSDVSFTFTTPGYYNYKCLFHGSMVGNIQVVSP